MRNVNKHLRILEFLESRNLLAAHLLGDLNDTQIQVEASNLTVLGGDVLFSDQEGLWRIDAETESVHFLGEVPIEPYAASVVLGDRFLWLGDDEVHGSEIWVSDGTASGTQLLRDINPGPDAGVIVDWADLSLTVDDVIYFTADGGRGFGVWKTDGTAAGTVAIYEPIENEIVDHTQQLVEFRGDVYFGSRIRALDGPRTIETQYLKKTTGIDAQVVMAGEPNGFARVIPLASTSKYVFFKVGSDLWRTDGSSIGSHALGASVDLGVATSGSFFFSYRGQLWVTDGTVEATAQISATCGCRVISDSPVTGRVFLERMRGIGPDIVFVDLLSLDVSTHDLDVLLDRWYVNGFSVYPTPPFWSVSESQIVFGPHVAFPAFDLFVSDGTVEGTTKLPKNVDPRFAVGTKQFTISDGIWVHDTVDGTSRRLPIDTMMTESSALPMDAFRVINGTTYFTVGKALWTTDGTEGGTKIVLTWPNAGFVRFIGGPVDGHAFLYATSRHSSRQREIWLTDGTTEGTRLFQRNVDLVNAFATANNHLILAHSGKWQTAAKVVAVNFNGDTETLAQFELPIQDDYAIRLYSFGEEVIFVVDDRRGEDTSAQVWATDGSVEGTRHLFDEESGYRLSVENGSWGFGEPGAAFLGDGVDSELIQRVARPGLGGFSPVQVNGRIAYVLGHDRRFLWLSDGPGLTSVFTLPSGNTFSRFLTSTDDGRLYFITSFRYRRGDLWITDGTREGTQLVKEDAQVGGGTAAIGDELFFRSLGADRELWKTDGTLEGTRQVLDLYAGEKSSYPRGLTTNGDKLYFSAETELGLEPWVYQAGESFLSGDANGDNEVSFDDFLALSANFGNIDAAFEDGDFDGDGVVGLADFLLLSANFGKRRISVPDLD